MWSGPANEQNFHQFARFNILGTLYTKLYNQRTMGISKGYALSLQSQEWNNVDTEENLAAKRYASKELESHQAAA